MVRRCRSREGALRAAAAVTGSRRLAGGALRGVAAAFRAGARDEVAFAATRLLVFRVFVPVAAEREPLTGRFSGFAERVTALADGLALATAFGVARRGVAGLVVVRAAVRPVARGDAVARRAVLVTRRAVFVTPRAVLVTWRLDFRAVFAAAVRRVAPVRVPELFRTALRLPPAALRLAITCSLFGRHRSARNQRLLTLTVTGK